MSGVRIATASLLVVGLIGLWKALELERWSFEGPGPGLFPTLVAVVFLALAVWVLIRPGREASDPEAEIEPADSGPIDRASPGAAASPKSTFAWTCAAVLVLAIGPQFAGFALTTLAVCTVVLRGAERRSWALALGYGVGAALIGLVLFGGVLRVDLPATALDKAIVSWIR
ncbi:MAG: tripartite tricarboxylate transporter TctB family protein [Burkholderiales bacterium]|jgi:hypothetical protein